MLRGIPLELVAGDVAQALMRREYAEEEMILRETFARKLEIAQRGSGWSGHPDVGSRGTVTQHLAACSAQEGTCKDQCEKGAVRRSYGYVSRLREKPPTRFRLSTQIL